MANIGRFWLYKCMHGCRFACHLHSHIYYIMDVLAKHNYIGYRREFYACTFKHLYILSDLANRIVNIANQMIAIETPSCFRTKIEWSPPPPEPSTEEREPSTEAPTEGVPSFEAPTQNANPIAMFDFTGPAKQTFRTQTGRVTIPTERR